MMKIIKSVILSFAAVLLAVSPVSAVALDAKGEYTSIGAGAASCAYVLEEYRKNSRAYKELLIWVTGYMTAAGRYNDTEKEFGNVADVDGIMHLIRDYCDENPLNHLSFAADNVAEQLLDKAGRR